MSCRLREVVTLPTALTMQGVGEGARQLGFLFKWWRSRTHQASFHPFVKARCKHVRFTLAFPVCGSELENVLRSVQRKPPSLNGAWGWVGYQEPQW